MTSDYEQLRTENAKMALELGRDLDTILAMQAVIEKLRSVVEIQYGAYITPSKLIDKVSEMFNGTVSALKILEDPFNFLLGLSKRDSLLEESFKDSDSDIIDFIVLPLYSARTGQVEEFSGLNQWNASGRKRDVDEVYIPIPAWIHRKKSGFFTYNTDDHKTEPFEVRLPSGDILSMRVAQQGGKGLMSDPNKALGNWLLRDVLNLKVGTVVTKEMLDIIGIDSVQLSKRKDGSYSLDFLKSGSFDSFKEQFDD